MNILFISDEFSSAKDKLSPDMIKVLNTLHTTNSKTELIEAENFDRILIHIEDLNKLEIISSKATIFNPTKYINLINYLYRNFLVDG